jgi:hypothetical protein
MTVRPSPGLQHDFLIFLYFKTIFEGVTYELLSDSQLMRIAGQEIPLLDTLHDQFKATKAEQEVGVTTPSQGLILIQIDRTIRIMALPSGEPGKHSKTAIVNRGIPTGTQNLVIRRQSSSPNLVQQDNNQLINAG